MANVLTSKLPTQEKPKIKYVKRAKLWCKTWFEKDNMGRYNQKQEWTVEKPERIKNET